MKAIRWDDVELVIKYLSHSEDKATIKAAEESTKEQVKTMKDAGIDFNKYALNTPEPGSEPEFWKCPHMIGTQGASCPMCRAEEASKKIIKQYDKTLIKLSEE